MTNLLKETCDILTSINKLPTDIIFIGSEVSGYTCTWGEFVRLADREYDSGYGAQEVAYDLIIVFSDGTKLSRSEYDGSERWRVDYPFEIPKITKPITSLFAKIGWDSLEDSNKFDDNEEV